jgi:hypothetical protein
MEKVKCFIGHLKSTKLTLAQMNEALTSSGCPLPPEIQSRLLSLSQGEEPVVKAEPARYEASESANQALLPSANPAGKIENLPQGIMDMTIHGDLIDEVEQKFKAKEATEWIGTGGFGYVYKLSASQNRKVAVKELKAKSPQNKPEVI